MPEKGSTNSLKPIELGGDDPAIQKAKERAETLKNALTDEGMKTVEELENEIREMSIASRFRDDKTIGENIGISGNRGKSFRENRTERENKRVQLLSDAQRIRSSLMDLAGRLENLVMDMEMTKKEG